MPQCQELVQLFSDGADSSAAEVNKYLDSAIFNEKEIMQQKKMSNPTGHYVLVCLPSIKHKKTHGTQHYAKK